MTKYHDQGRPRPKRLAEPVQVYLDPDDRERLERLQSELGATKSDILRRALTALESQTRRTTPSVSLGPPLPTFAGKGLQPGVDLDDAAGLLDIMDAGDASR